MSHATAHEGSAGRAPAESWLQPGEILLLGCAPIEGYVAARIGTQLRIPHAPIGDVPELDAGRIHWPLPAEATSLDPELEWVDDPTLGYWLTAPHPDTIAVRLADHFAHSHGKATFVLTDQRVAVVYPTRLLSPRNAPGSSPFTAHAEHPRAALVGLDVLFIGQSLPATRVIRLTFADGSILQLRHPDAAAHVHRVRRAAPLCDLLALHVPIGEAARALREHEPDSRRKLITVSRVHAVRLLDAYLAGELSARECRQWADVLDVREDVGRAPGSEDLLNDFLFAIATPGSAGPLTPDVARQWLTRLLDAG